MNKTQLIEVIAEQNELTKAAAGKVLKSVITMIEDTLAIGGEVSIRGFGRFYAGELKARTIKGFHGDIEMDAMKTPRFKAGNALKNKIR